MSPDAELMLLFGALHLVALGFGCLLFTMFLRSDPVRHWRQDEEDGGGGGGGGPGLEPRHPTPRGGGGVPLPDAQPAGLRLRGPGRAQWPRQRRRIAREPAPLRPRQPAR